MKIDPSTLAELAQRATATAIAIGEIRFEITEAADGSGRYVALIGWEGDHRIFTPAPEGAPSWAAVRFPEWLEVVG